MSERKLSLFSQGYAMLCLVTQLCPTLCDPMDCSPPGSSVQGDSPGKNTGVGCHALLQGIFPTQGSNPSTLHCRQILYHLSHQGSPRILEWVAYPFSSRSSQPRMEPISPALQEDSLPAALPGIPSKAKRSLILKISPGVASLGEGCVNFFLPVAIYG